MKKIKNNKIKTLIPKLILRISLDPWQKIFLATKGDKILYTGRQVGKSVLCAMDCGEWGTTSRNKVILMIAPTERQAYALFEKTLTYIIDNKPNMIMKGRNRPTKSRIKLTNGTIIWCLPTGLTGLGIRFLTVDRLYAEEAARIPEAVWVAVTPMLLTTGGDSIYLTTPFGTESEAHNCFVNKDHAYDSFTRFSCDSETVITKRKICKTWTIIQRDKALLKLKQAKARMTELEYAQEYLGRPMVGLKQVFPDKLLKEILILKRTPKKQGRDYFLGQDIAGMGKDQSTWEILDGTDSRNIIQVENIIKQKWRTPKRVKLTISLERQWNFNKIGVDSGGMGSGDFDYLLKEESTRRKVIGLDNASKKLDNDGGKKKLLKEEMYNNLLAIMDMREIKLLDDDEIYHSLSSVQFEIINGKAKYHGRDTHIAEGLIRAAWCVKEKGLNLFFHTR